MERRNTLQKEQILNAVMQLKSHVTAQEIFDYVRKINPNIGQGTVYRGLGILAEEGKIRKVCVPDGPDYFDFTLKNHYHVKCIHCNRIFDVDMDATDNPINHIRDTHGFDFLESDIFFKGICPQCQKQKEDN